MIILLTLSCDILRLWRDAAEFQHHGQRESSRWKARSLSMVLDRARQQQSAAEPPDICTRWHVYISPITWISPRQSTHIFFSIHVSVCEDYILLRPTRSNKKKKRKQAIIAMVCNTIHGTVKEAWEVNRIGCGGDCSPHVEKKESESLSSHRLQLYFNPEAHTVWPTQLNHMHIAISVKGLLNESTNTRVECFSFSFKKK